jgi:hypothetical protein
MFLDWIRIYDKVIKEFEEDRRLCLLSGLLSPICQRQCPFPGRSTFCFGITLSRLQKSRAAAGIPVSLAAENARSRLPVREKKRRFET